MERHGGSLHACAYVREPNRKGLPPVWVPNRQNYGDSDGVLSGFQGLVVRERWTGRTPRVLRAVKYSVWYYNGEYMTLYICQTPQEVSTRESLDINHRRWAIRTCQWRSLDHSECTAPVRNVDSGEARHARGKKACWTSLYLLLNFAENLKLKNTLKNDIYWKFKNKKECEGFWIN